MKTENTGPPDSKKRFDTRKTLIAFLGFGISGAALWYVFRGVKVDELLATAHRIRILPLVGSIVAYWAVLTVLRAHLIRHLLRTIGPISLTKTYRYICIGFLVNNILPLRMGEIARIAGISRSSGIPFTSVAGGIAIERLLDLAMAALVGLVAIQLAPLQENIQRAVLVTGGAIFLALAVLTFLARRGIREKTDSKKGSIPALFHRLLARFTAGLGSLNSTRDIAIAMALSAMMWLTILGLMLLRLLAFDLPATLPVVFVLLTSLSLGVSLPSAPAYVGVYHAFAAGALMLFGIDEEVALGYAIFSHLTDIVPSYFLGGASMILEGLRPSDLRSGGSLRHSE